MTHIANCMRPDVDKTNVYITQETPSTRSPTARVFGSRLSKLGLQQQPTSKYQLWPTTSNRSPVGFNRPALLSDRSIALSMGRSATSLSDTAVSPDSVPFWHRGGSLSRRRKVSVPELGGTMTTVQESAIDSPTIPGRPPLRKSPSEGFGHERSSSAPGTNWRTGPFGDALVSCVTGPSYTQLEHSFPMAPSELSKSELLLPSSGGKPLSPILSPSVLPRPVLKVETGPPLLEAMDIPPEVPPKSPFVERKGSPAPKITSKSSKVQLATPVIATPTLISPSSAVGGRRSPNAPNTAAISAPTSAVERRGSPKAEARPERPNIHTRNNSDTSILDRGRPVKRSSKRQRSRTCSEINTSDTIAPDTWKLPKGMRAVDASSQMNEAEKEGLRLQAIDQAGQFEVLNKKDVASLSRELRALDERCEYLRKTYKSLRAGRQKLHGRMISYLKRGEAVIFSRENLLKQEEALAELDVSIDEFILKLEQAENRRLRFRQKLLEHVAAALVLNPPPSNNAADVAESTPPRSPDKTESPSRIDRKDVESIKIYADSHVLNLFSDIETAIGKMCEAC
ncbi:hypothetical protein BU16DRAFT_456867 [Lophium mytilinum]|uniref:Up-regulated during septation protein 1 domain-containing protein n=1 Tax=Lophium mytilinum TaxID=390894 RepID=A0A6A6QZ93_9PEZI|nr:hypothetical protein BU16DRAFT_456867 [Lophium mytilinum]